MAAIKLIGPIHTKSEEFTPFQQYTSIIVGNHVFIQISNNTQFEKF